METEVIIALVVSGLAFLGTIVSLIVSFISQKSLNEKQFKEKQIFKNYELYIDKKHEAYLKLWANLIEAISAVNNQRGLKELMPLGLSTTSTPLGWNMGHRCLREWAQ